MKIFRWIWNNIFALYTVIVVVIAIFGTTLTGIGYPANLWVEETISLIQRERFYDVSATVPGIVVILALSFLILAVSLIAFVKVVYSLVKIFQHFLGNI